LAAAKSFHAAYWSRLRRISTGPDRTSFPILPSWIDSPAIGLRDSGTKARLECRAPRFLRMSAIDYSNRGAASA
jgi:hypothetical protein